VTYSYFVEEFVEFVSDILVGSLGRKRNWFSVRKVLDFLVVRIIVKGNHCCAFVSTCYILIFFSCCLIVLTQVCRLCII
jgi:hypothetical protein